MTNIQIDLEFAKISNEIDEKSRFKLPYPESVIRMKELLLAAQVELSELLYAKRDNNKKREELHTVLYKTKIKQYYSCKNECSLVY